VDCDPLLSELAVCIESAEFEKSRRIESWRGNEKDVRSFRVLAGIFEGDRKRRGS